MYTIKSSDFFKKGGINTALTAIEVVKNIADDYSSDHRLYVIYALNYKIEFSFNENTSIHYLMVEKTKPNGTKVKKEVGRPDYVRSGVKNYAVKKILMDDTSRALIFIIEKKERSVAGDSFRYMVEATLID